MGLEIMNESHSLWRKVISSIHGSSAFDWFTSGKYNACLHSQWMNTSKCWQRFDYLASFKLGNGKIILFWQDIWIGGSSLKLLLSAFICYIILSQWIDF